LKDLDQNETMLPHATRGRKKMTIHDACNKAVAEGDHRSALVIPMEGTFLDPLFWQA